jgi:hypothetical protein
LIDFRLSRLFKLPVAPHLDDAIAASNIAFLIRMRSAGRSVRSFIVSLTVHSRTFARFIGAFVARFLADLFACPSLTSRLFARFGLPALLAKFFLGTGQRKG